MELDEELTPSVLIPLTGREVDVPWRGGVGRGVSLQKPTVGWDFLYEMYVPFFSSYGLRGFRALTATVSV